MLHYLFKRITSEAEGLGFEGFLSPKLLLILGMFLTLGQSGDLYFIIRDVKVDGTASQTFMYTRIT